MIKINNYIFINTVISLGSIGTVGTGTVNFLFCTESGVKYNSGIRIRRKSDPDLKIKFLRYTTFS